MTGEGLTLTWTGPKRRRRVRFEPESTGAWRRETATFRMGRWQTEGSELVNDVGVEVGANVRDAVEIIDDAWRQEIHND